MNLLMRKIQKKCEHLSNWKDFNMIYKRIIITYVMVKILMMLLISVDCAPIAGGEPVPEDGLTVVNIKCKMDIEKNLH